MIIDTDNVMLGLAWNLEEAERVLEEPEDDEWADLPVILLAVIAEDEESALDLWREKYPHLAIDKVAPLNTLIDEGAIS